MKKPNKSRDFNNQDLARWLLDFEAAAGKSSDGDFYAVYQVCGKLRSFLSELAGVAGYRSVLCRALALAKAEAPGLKAFNVDQDGNLEILVKKGSGKQSAELSNGDLILVSKFLELLDTFIGEKLTQKLIHDVWPEAPFKDMEHGRRKKTA